VRVVNSDFCAKCFRDEGKSRGLGLLRSAQLSSAQLTPFWSFTAKARKELKGEAQKAANAAP